ncbi:sugar transferase [Myxosarcina sp. GI1]|uniref:sugar transferase n=1 Tax=Myxosarcina sp. GI1 TaxID=1541065 RepID=UPI00068F048C|nr:sugar transferase [Myxosarcina sp. GI1]
MLENYTSTTSEQSSNFFSQEVDKSRVVRDLRSPGFFKIAIHQLIYLAKVLILILLDNLGLAVAWLISENMRFLASEKITIDNSPNDLIIPAIILNLCFFITCGLYGKNDRSRNFIDLIKAITFTHIVLLSVAFEYCDPNCFYQLLAAWFLTVVLTSMQRLSLFSLVSYLRRQYSPLRFKIMLLGDREDIAKTEALLEGNTMFQVEAKLDLSEFRQRDGLTIALDKIDYRNIDEIFICSWEQIKESTSLFWKLKCTGVDWRIIPINFKVPQHRKNIVTVKGIPTIKFHNPTLIGIDFFSKRVFDLVVSSLLLLILGLPMLIIALAIKLDSSGSIFYKQTRVGLKNEHFQVWKFRTMVENASQLQQQLEARNEIKGGVLFKMKDDPRITRVGKFLRKYSLDELPQLFNVLRGEMSLVGPRPLPVRDVAKFSRNHFFRHEVLPGITGLWQVSGRSDTDSENVFNLDFEYIQDWSLALDFKILLRTVGVVFTSKGAY